MRDAIAKATEELNKLKELHLKEMTLFRQQQEQKDAAYRKAIDELSGDDTAKLAKMQAIHDSEKRSMVDLHTQEMKARLEEYTKGEM